MTTDAEYLAELRESRPAWPTPTAEDTYREVSQPPALYEVPGRLPLVKLRYEGKGSLMAGVVQPPMFRKVEKRRISDDALISTRYVRVDDASWRGRTFKEGDEAIVSWRDAELLIEGNPGSFEIVQRDIYPEGTEP